MIRKVAVSLLGASAVMAATSALAADVSMPTMPAPAPIVVVPPAAPQGFDWTRFYVGVSVGSWRENDFGPHTDPIDRLMGNAGFNFAVGSRLVVGVEAQAGVNDFLGGGGDFEWALLGKAGFTLGQRALLFATAGASNGPNNDIGVLFGGGFEIGLGNRFSIHAETLIFNDFDGDFVDHYLFNAGINLYFGG